MEQVKRKNYKDIFDLLPRKELTYIPFNLHTMQEKIKTLFARALDLDSSGKEPVQKKMMDYYNAKGGDMLNTFQFQPQSMSFEIIDRKTLTKNIWISSSISFGSA